MNQAHSTNLRKYTASGSLQAAVIQRFLKRVSALIAPLKIQTILDAGCGEGFALKFLLDHHAEMKAVGVDLSAAALEYARTQIPTVEFIQGSIEQLPFPDQSFDAVMALEVLEHLNEPRRALLELKRVSRVYCVISVPHEPWFRLANFLRGKYFLRLGNHPEHVQQWSKAAITHLVSEYFEVLEAHSIFPWTLILARQKRS